MLFYTFPKITRNKNLRNPFTKRISWYSKKGSNINKYRRSVQIMVESKTKNLKNLSEISDIFVSRNYIPDFFGQDIN